MNFRGHFYGIESFNTKSARAMGKGMEGERLKEGLIEIRKDFENDGTNLYRGTISLITGLPFEDVASLDKTSQWLVDNWQGQNFVMNLLEISIHEWVKPSKLSVDYKKYGYVDLDGIQEKSVVSTVEKGGYASIEDFDGMMRWKNEYMDIYEADNIVKKFVKLKDDYEFRIQTYRLASRFKNAKTVQQRLDIIPKNNEIALCETSVDNYINRKLSI
jgi:hypothetical protein